MFSNVFGKAAAQSIVFNHIFEEVFPDLVFYKTFGEIDSEELVFHSAVGMTACPNHAF